MAAGVPKTNANGAVSRSRSLTPDLGCGLLDGTSQRTSDQSKSPNFPSPGEVLRRRCAAAQMTRSHSVAELSPKRTTIFENGTRKQSQDALSRIPVEIRDQQSGLEWQLPVAAEESTHIASNATEIDTGFGLDSETKYHTSRARTDDRQPAEALEKGHPQACLFVASLSSARSDLDLQRSVTLHFQQWGKLLHVKVLKDWLSRPYAFVQFRDIRDAKRALTEAHNTLIHGRYIRVEQARVNRTLFIAKFGKTIGEHVRDANDVKRNLMEILERYGPVEDFTILQNYQTGRSKGCGFVKFCFREDAIKAYLSLRSNLKWVAEWAANLDRGNIDIDHSSIFVGQLNQAEVTRELLEEKFAKYGTIQSMQLINRYPSGPNTRPAFAFIKFSDETSTTSAVQEENAQSWLNRTIRVQYRETGDFRLQRAPYGHEYNPAVQYIMPSPRGSQSADLTSVRTRKYDARSNIPNVAAGHESVICQMPYPIYPLGYDVQPGQYLHYAATPRLDRFNAPAANTLFLASNLNQRGNALPVKFYPGQLHPSTTTGWNANPNLMQGGPLEGRSNQPIVYEETYDESMGKWDKGSRQGAPGSRIY
ncbi:hypothetical protein DFJ77DRAFT_469073 [Powellomyces hirtus]|nr:hypothetical protein DFJ77DRAFT_469073 [Powellomyces hirtus]